MSLRSLAEQPWINQSADVYPGAPLSLAPAKKTALNFLIAMIFVVFSLFFITLFARSQYPDFRPLASESWMPLYDSTRLWISTLLLALTGASLEGLTRLSTLKPSHQRGLAIATCLFALGFLFSQALLWRHVANLGFGASGNPANSYFYLLTGLHALHVLAGLTVLIAQTYTLQFTGNRDALSFNLSRRYWHVMLALWAAVFSLLVASPQTYATLAALCGYGA